MNDVLKIFIQIAVPILVLGVLIMVHELGHFGVAKFFKIKVLEFWIFMGPKIFKWKRKETEYSLRVIPIGGMVRMEGEEVTSDDEGAFSNKHPLKRAAVIAAGPVMNILFALLVVIIISGISGYVINSVKLSDDPSSAKSAGIMNGDKILAINDVAVFDPTIDYGLFTYIKSTKPIVFTVQRQGVAQPLRIPVTPDERYLLGIQLPKSTANPEPIEVVSEGMPAKAAGIKVGDIITAVDGNLMKSNFQTSELIKSSAGKELTLTIKRDKKDITIKVTPKKEIDMSLGIRFDTSSGNPIDVLGTSVGYCVSTMRSNFITIGWLVSGNVSVKELSGPVGMVKIMGDVATYSPSFWDNLKALMLTASFISLCLGVFNLLPFPALDGSKILILIFEIFTKKKLKPEREAAISLVGLAILLSFMVFVTVMDVIKFF